MGPTGATGPAGPQGPIGNVTDVEPVGLEDSPYNVVIGMTYNPETQTLQFNRQDVRQVADLYWEEIANA